MFWSFIHLYLNTSSTFLMVQIPIKLLVQQSKLFNSTAMTMTNQGGMFCVDPFVVALCHDRP